MVNPSGIPKRAVAALHDGCADDESADEPDDEGIGFGSEECAEDGLPGQEVVLVDKARKSCTSCKIVRTFGVPVTPGASAGIGGTDSATGGGLLPESAAPD